MMSVSLERSIASVNDDESITNGNGPLYIHITLLIATCSKSKTKTLTAIQTPSILAHCVLCFHKVTISLGVILRSAACRNMSPS